MKPYEHIVSVSGGKDSTALYLLAMERGRPFRAVFADTGNEHDWTYEAVRLLAQRTGGPEVEWVKADLSHRVIRKRDYIRDKWPLKGVPDDVVQRALAIMHPTGNPFIDLCLWKNRFPSTKRRFCTEELKVLPITEQIVRPIHDAGRKVISWQGVRADESLARRHLPKFQMVKQEDIWVRAFRPLLTWTVEDVWAMHTKHGVPRNPLYNHGMGRVGCMPCINANKAELNAISITFPEHIDKIEEWERIVSLAAKHGIATFFPAKSDPMLGPRRSVADVKAHGHGIRSMVRWSHTTRGGRQYDLTKYNPTIEFSTACSDWGVCE